MLLAFYVSVLSATCTLSVWEQAILDKHNEWRSNTSPPAKDMHKVRWDTNIAATIRGHIGRCDSNWPHSDQNTVRKDVGGFEYLGENLAYCAGTACEALMSDGTPGYLGQSWWDEKDDYNWASDSSNGGVTSHYTQMSSSNIYAMGCAAVKCPSPGPWGWNGEWWEFGCQYGERGQGYWVGTKPFEQGSGGLIEPDSSVFTKNPGLCNDGNSPPSNPTPAPPAPVTSAPSSSGGGGGGGGGGSSCPLSVWEQAILDKHNEWRSNTSPPAKDMHKVRWDTNIAATIRGHIGRCDSNWPHSDQNTVRKDVGGFEYLGENLAYCAGTACEALMSDGTPGYLGQSWWDEKDDYNWASDSSNGGVTSHYTQMSSSNIYAMGCAAVKCPSPGPWGWNGEWWEFGCQYGERGQGYWVGTKPFEQGSGGLIEPDSSVFTKNPGLCNDGNSPPSNPTPAPPAPVTSAPSSSGGGGGGSSCPLSVWEQAILDKHNEWRSNTSPPAKDMHKVRWDTNIAATIRGHIGRCDSNWPHSDQNTVRKDVGGYEYLGENLAYCAGTACEALMSDGTPGYLGQSWWDEKDDYNWASDSSNGGVTSHYTQMSSSNIYAMGCAAVKCPSPGPWGWNGEWWEFGCQYGERGQGYWVGTKPFEQGSGGLIEPDSSVFTKNPGLCNDGNSPPSNPTPAPPAPVTSAPSSGGGGGGGSSCPLSVWEQAILDKHNEWRSNTSPPAKDMHKVRWDTNIAATIRGHIGRCDSNWPHSDQNTVRKDVGGYEYLGENLAYCAGTACEALMSDGTPGYLGQSWWDEKDDYNWASDSSNGGVTSHYTQMSSSNIYAMGCAAVKCPSPGPWGWNGEWWEFGCQYGERGQGYWVGTKPFEQGSGGLIEPDSSVFTKNPGLCNDGNSPPSNPTPAPPAPVTSAPSSSGGGGGGGGSSCPLSVWEQAILDKHNEWRSNTSPPAKDMHKVRWDTNIAATIRGHIGRCDSNWPHSDQNTVRKDVGGFEYLGENLAYCAGTACEALMSDGTPGYLGQSWWDEKDDYNWASDSSNGGVTSHYTQMSSSNIYAMGCAAVKCPSPGPWGWNGEWWEFGCQYGERGQGYWVGTKPFEQGSGGLIEPDSSVFTKNPGLCNDGNSPPSNPTPAPPAPVTSAPSSGGGGGGSSCPLSVWEQAILDKHNEWRSNTSPPAKDMHKVRWDTNIAATIRGHIGRCDSNWPHSDQNTVRKDVGGFEYLGENLAYCAGTACEALMSDGTPGYLGQSWWDEKDDYNWASDSSNGGVTSHYTQMSSSNIYAMGCAAVKCPSPGPWGWNGEWWEFGCQYGERGQGYWVGTKPFEQGSGGLIEPDSSVFTKNPGLCKDKVAGTTTSPATSAPDTTAPSTAAPDTTAPSTSTPATSAPSTSAPDTTAPSTNPPDTTAPTTGVPDTVAPKTDAPDTTAPKTSAPDTTAPATGVPETVAPDTSAPDTDAPKTQVPTTLVPGKSGAPDTTAPDTDAPATAAPATGAPATSAPATTAPVTGAPDTVAPDTMPPVTDAPETTAPETEAPDTGAPDTPVPMTLVPGKSGAPDTAAPDTDAPKTTAPDTDAPKTQAPITRSPRTDPPVTVSPETSAPDTGAPKTQTPSTLAPGKTGAPATMAPETNVPETTAPKTSAPATDAPSTLTPGKTGAPETSAPSTRAPSTRAPDTTAPRTQVPTTLVPGETAAPDTMAPKTQVPKTLVPGETVAPDTNAPKTEVPKTLVPGETAAPDTMAPKTQVPKTLVPGETAAPDTMAPKTQVPKTLVPGETAAPDTTAPKTEVPKTLVPGETAAPDTMAPKTQVPKTLVPGETAAPDTTAPKTEVPKTLVPGETAAPDTMAPKTQVPRTLVPGETAAPDTMAPATQVPKTLVPGETASPATEAPSTARPSTLAPGQTKAPSTDVPKTRAPGTPVPASVGSECGRKPCGSDQDCHDPSEKAGDFVCMCRGASVRAVGERAECEFDECAEAKKTGLSLCGGDQNCRDPETAADSRGDYVCTCKTDADRKRVGGKVGVCERDECEDSPCGDKQTCTDDDKRVTPKKNFECSCKGTTAVGMVAVCEAGPVDECSSSPCGADQVCTDPVQTAGSTGDFVCSCKEGTSKATGEAVTDCKVGAEAPGCEADPCKAGEECTATEKGFRCSCGWGTGSRENGPVGSCGYDECFVRKDGLEAPSSGSSSSGPCGEEQECEDPMKTFDSVKDYTCTCKKGSKEPATGRPVEKCGDDDSFNWLPVILGILGGLLAICGIAAAVVMRKKKSSGPSIQEFMTYTEPEYSAKNGEMETFKL